MFRFKTLMFLILVASMILSACGGQATTPPTAATEAPAATEPPAATEAPATEAPASTEAPTEVSQLSGKVTIWMWKAAHDALTNSGVLDEFKKVQPDVEVEVDRKSVV